MIKAVIKQILDTDDVDSPCTSQLIWNQCVVKGFAIGPVWVVPILAALSHIFMDIRFEPYGFALYPVNVKIVLSLIYGVVLGGGFYLALVFLHGSGNKVWALWKEILWLILTVFVITSINFILRQFLFSKVFFIQHLYPISYGRFLLVGAEVAGITALIFEFIQFVLIKSGMPIADEKTEQPSSNVQSLSLTVQGKGKQEQLKLTLDTFVYAQSDGNYIKLFYFNENDGSLESEMLRLSLQDFLAQVSDFDSIVRVHKSFVFNLSQGYAINGNSRRANLQILALDKEIPVSRAFYNEHQLDK